MLKKLYIEPTTKCNLTCKMCFRHTWFDEPICDLSLEDYRQVLSTMPKTVQTIFFGGMGEPLFHKDILEMIRLAAQTGAAVELLTNGTLLTEEMIYGILDAGLPRLWISLDDLQTDSSINAANSAGGDHAGHNHSGLVLSNIRMLNKIRQKALSSISLGITFVAMKSNAHQLAKLPFFDLNIPEAADGIRSLMRKQNFNLYFNDQPVLRKTGYCKFVREGMTFVRADGKVCPCMALLHNGYTYLHDIRRKITHCSFGNIKEQPLAEIWSSQEYKTFRRKFDEFDFASCLYCGHCELFEENQEDCIGNIHPACGGCLWAEGVLSCP